MDEDHLFTWERDRRPQRARLIWPLGVFIAAIVAAVLLGLVQS